LPLTAAIAGDLGLIADTLWSATAALSESVRQRYAARTADVTVAEGADAVALAEPAWRTLEAQGGAATPFQAFAVAARAAEAHLKLREVPRIVTVSESGRPMVVFPTVLGRYGGRPAARFLGDPLIQYGDIIASPDATPSHFEAAWRVAADPAAVGFVHLRKVRADARIAPFLVRNASVVGQYEAPYVDLRAPAAIGSRDARELRRFRRRLADHGELRFEILGGGAALPAVREALAIKRAWIAERGLPSSVIGKAVWEAALCALAAPGPSPLRAARLSAGGRIVAVEIGFVSGGTWSAYLGATAPFAAKAGPGHVQMAELIERSRADGLGTYDLQAPADAYKRTIAHGAVTVRDYALPVSMRGWLGMVSTRAMPAVKEAIARLPLGIRQTIVRLRG